MQIKGLVDEDFINYKVPSMFIAFPICRGFKCGKELCQNSPLALSPNIEIDAKTIINRYLKNPITKAIVLGGLEPFDTYIDLLDFIKAFRKVSTDEIVIYTGYTEKELRIECAELREYAPIIVKFGRYIPNEKSHYDEVLGVELASDNQYAVKL